MYPRSGDLTQELADAIEQDLSDFEKAMYSYDYDSSFYGYETLIDVQSFVDYFILNEFTCNYDAGTLSTYLYKDIKENISCASGISIPLATIMRDPTTLPHHFRMQDTVWYYMLIKDEEFCGTHHRSLSRAARDLAQRRVSEQLYGRDHCLFGDAVQRNYEVYGDTPLQIICRCSQQNAIPRILRRRYSR